jgi:hypothetical protein
MASLGRTFREVFHDQGELGLDCLKILIGQLLSGRRIGPGSSEIPRLIDGSFLLDKSFVDGKIYSAVCFTD